MPGHTLITDAAPEALREVALSVASELGFKVTAIDDWNLAICKGSMAASIFLGAFIAYCNFQAAIVQPGDGTTHPVIQRNSPWWTGMIGVKRVKKRAKELAEALGRNLTATGIQVHQMIEFK